VKRQKLRAKAMLTLEELEAWLESLDPPAPGVSMIDGFLAALVVSPRFIHPEEWIWHIVGDRGRWALEGSTEAAATQAIVARYNEISSTLSERPERYAPIFMRTDDGEVLIEDWANGFFGAMRLSIKDWLPFITDPETALPMAAILAHSTGMGENPLIRELGKKGATEALADSWRVIPEVVAMLYQRCADARNASSR
jgi:uncharacterized protein